MAKLVWWRRPSSETLQRDMQGNIPLRGWLTRLFEGGLGPRVESFLPSLEVVERDDEYLLRADLPGVRAEDVNVRVEDGDLLLISGERRREETKRHRGSEYTERSYGSFMRSIELPSRADPSAIEADFRNGVLEVHVPKREARSRQVAVRNGGQRGSDISGRRDNDRDRSSASAHAPQ